MPQDQWGWVDTVYQLWDTNGTPDDTSDDLLLATKAVTSWDIRTVTSLNWMDLYTAPYSEIKDGHQYRLQAQDDYPDATNMHGINSFAIGAFRSWDPSGCDARVAPDCPRVYGRGAVSVFNNLVPSDGSKAVSFYLAEISPSFTGRTFNVYLWDPGEGVTKMDLLAPDGTPLAFDWTTAPTCPGCSGTNATALDACGTGPQPGPNRSNDYKFNDRLVTLGVTIPPGYVNMVANAGGDQWIRMRYTVGTTPSDRITWGVELAGAGSSSSPPHLARFSSAP